MRTHAAPSLKGTTTMPNDCDLLAALFAGETRTIAEIAADMETARASEAARIAAVKADRAAFRVRTAHDCPRCAGRGYLPQFQYHKGGECFACGATGVAP
jgi:alkylhydroperoxidase family enzyme